MKRSFPKHAKSQSKNGGGTDMLGNHVLEKRSS